MRSLTELLPTILRKYFNVGDSWAKSQVFTECAVDIKDRKATLRGQEKLVDLKKKKGHQNWAHGERQKLNCVLRRQASATQEKLPRQNRGESRNIETSTPFLGPELLAEANAPCSELRVQSGDGEASQVKQNNTNRTTLRGTGWAAGKGWAREKRRVRQTDTEVLCKAHT